MLGHSRLYAELQAKRREAAAWRVLQVVGVVGLGAGTLATYTVPGSRMRYFEIDPEVERIARDPQYFTYLSECAKGTVDVVLGDARLTLADAPDGSYDVLVLDALRPAWHPTHFSLGEALAAVEEIGAGETWLTHLGHENEHGELLKALPPGVNRGFAGSVLPPSTRPHVHSRLTAPSSSRQSPPSG